MKRNLKEKMLAWVLTLTMVVTLIPAIGGVAYADEEQEVTAAEEPEKIQVPDPLTYKTVIDGVDGEIPHSGQTLTKNQINNMFVATGGTAADVYKLKVNQLERLNNGHWDNMNLFSLDEFTFEADTKYRVHAYFQLDLSKYELKTYGDDGKRIHVKVNGDQLSEGNARYDTTVYNGKNNISIDYEFTPKTTITSLDYTGFLEPAIEESSYYRQMTEGIKDKTHSDITGALDSSGMLYKYNDDETLTVIQSEQSNPYPFQYGKYKVEFACVVRDDKYYIDTTKPEDMTVIINGVKANVTGIWSNTSDGYYVIECWRDMYLDQGPVMDFALKNSELIYNGEEQLPEVVVKSSLGRILDSSTYTVSTTDECMDVGTYSVKIEMKEGSGYTGDETLTFKIVPNPASCSLNNAELTYNGKAQAPSVIVKDSFGKVLDSSKYTVSYGGGRTNIGAYPVTVAMKPDSGYTGSKTLYFNINPKGATIKKPSAAKKAFTAKWKKQSSKMPKARITGYQVRYSTNPSFPANATKYKNVKKYSKTSVKVKKLTKKTRYYIQVRTYMKVGGKNYYSNWSGVKSVKTK